MPLSAGVAAVGGTISRGVRRNSLTVVNFCHTRRSARSGGWRLGRVAWSRWLSCMRPGWARARSTPGARGRLVRLHRGVYAVGHAQLTRARLALGGGAGVWWPRPRGAQPQERRRGLGPASFTREVRRQHPRAAHGRRRRSGSIAGRCNREDITTIDGLPLTTVARTLVDLTATLTPHQTERVVHRAEHLRLLDTHSLDEQLARAQGRPHEAAASRDRTAAGKRSQTSPAPFSRSGSSPSSSMRSCRGPRSTRWWAKRKSTSSGARERFIVETDGAATHLTAEAFEEDRRRDAVHSMMGFRTLRFTWRQVVYEPRFVARGDSGRARGVASRLDGRRRHAHHQRRRASAHGRHPHHAARPPPRAPRPHGREEGLRPRPVRLVHDPDRRAAGEQLPRARGRARRRRADHRSRGSGARRSCTRCRRPSSSATPSSAATARPASCAPRSG